eukprot:4564401-Pyramimonas_sp.AAC.1
MAPAGGGHHVRTRSPPTAEGVAKSVRAKLSKDQSLVAVNTTPYGPMLDYLACATECVIAIQEHRVTPELLADKQHAVLDAGYRGLWAPAIHSDGGGAGITGGVAVVVPSHIGFCAPPGDSHTIIPGRAVACHVNWGVHGGMVVLSMHLKGGE